MNKVDGRTHAYHYCGKVLTLESIGRKQKNSEGNVIIKQTFYRESLGPIFHVIGSFLSQHH